MLLILAGITAGFVHVFSGPDHLAAIAPLAVRKQARAWESGLRWGLGHAFGVAIIGVTLLLLRELLPLEAISDWSERLVGFLLLAIGFWGLRKAFDRRIHSHEHSHDGVTHLHIHLHDHLAHAPREKLEHRHRHAVFGIGTLHGLAGSSHLYALVPVVVVGSFGMALLYLGAYAAGCVAAMCLFSGTIGLIGQKFSVNNTTAYRGLMGASSLASVLIGVYWISSTFIP